MNLSAESVNVLRELFGDSFCDKIKTSEGISNLDQENEENSDFEESIGDFKFSLRLAEDDLNEDKKSLFATYLWNGSKMLSKYLVENLNTFMEGKTVIEFGSGAGLPSLVCNKLGASVVCATDYPAESVINVLQENIDRNMNIENGDMIVMPHKWGDDCTELLGINGGQKFDVVLASECLWRHEQVFKHIK